jgi:hypothetical protein
VIAQNIGNEYILYNSGSISAQEASQRDSLGAVSVKEDRFAEGERPVGSRPHAIESSVEVFRCDDARRFEREECMGIHRELVKTRGTSFERSFRSRGNHTYLTD